MAENYELIHRALPQSHTAQLRQQCGDHHEGITSGQNLKQKLGRISHPDPVVPELDLTSYFKIGVSRDYILIRDDFPIKEIPPGDFTKLCKEMFRRNEKVLYDGK